MPREIVKGLDTRRIGQKLRAGAYADGNGLYLHVSRTGSSRWFWRGMVRGRRRELGLGSARLISLIEAREVARQMRRAARAGGDPVDARNAARQIIAAMWTSGNPAA